MKTLLSVLLMVCLLVVPVHAEGIPGQPLEAEATEQEDQVVVKSLEELQEAMDAANDGDTIRIASSIEVKNQEVVTDKNITLMRTGDFTSCLFHCIMVAKFLVLQ